MKKNSIIISSIILAAFGAVFAASSAEAALINTGPDLGTAYPAYAGLSDTDPRIVAAQVVRIALGLLGTIFLAIVFYGGYLWMTAGGNDEQIGQAKSWITSGVVGLAIILSAFGITTFVLNQLTVATF